MGWIVTCSVFRFRFRHSFLWFSPRFFCERISTSLADLLLEHSGPNLSQRMLSRNTFWSSNLPFVLQLLVENALQCNFCADSSYVQFVLSREFVVNSPRVLLKFGWVSVDILRSRGHPSPRIFFFWCDTAIFCEWVG